MVSKNFLKINIMAVLFGSGANQTTLNYASTFQIGKNCLSPKGATTILRFIKQHMNMGLEYIDMAVSVMILNSLLILYR